MIPVRTRFAPSPTGYLHIGGVRTALFNYLYAKQHGGQFILRIDDTDQQRNVEDALQPILDGFRWLGLRWDEGPEVGGPCGEYFQSKRSENYQRAVQQLLDSGHAYRDYARPEELQAQREEAEKSGVAFIYNRRWMAEDDDQARLFESEGRSAVVRLKMPREGSCQFLDLVRGSVEFHWDAEQDHVIQRNDGTCLYHLASVVDDHEFRISHVIRAVEHLPNTPRQIFIAQSLGYDVPKFAHLPYVAEPGGTSKLSKRKLDKYLKNPDFASLYELGRGIAAKAHLDRDCSLATFNPVVVDFYREIGFLPEALLNYLLLLGWSLDDSTEHFSMDDAVKHFTLDRVNKSPASFDPQKLLAFQQRWFGTLDLEAKVDRAIPFLIKAGFVKEGNDDKVREYVHSVVKAGGERFRLAGDILQFDEFFAPDEQLVYDDSAWQKRFEGDAIGRELLDGWQRQLESIEPFDAAALETSAKAYVDLQHAKIGQLIHALRVAVTGKSTGFGMFETMEVLGKVRVLNRIRLAFARLESSTKLAT